MIVPSIDLIDGKSVQLIGGREPVLEAGDPRPLAERFALAGEVAIVDLDAAWRRGSNAGLVRDLLRIAPCRVGGGIRSVAEARKWLDAGAVRVVLGTAAVPEILRELPPERVVVALDAVDGEVVVDGWRRRTGQDVYARMEQLKAHTSGFLVTFVEREGRMGGVDLETVERLARTAGEARLTVAGGISTPDEIAALDRLGVDAQVGMALYRGRLRLGDAISAPMVSDRADGLWPTIVADSCGHVLGLAWSSAESLRLAVDQRQGVYHSRRRGIWRKGETSGNTQELLRVDLDCDRDTLLFTVRQQGLFCHTDRRTCFGPGRGLPALEQRIEARSTQRPPGSLTSRLLDDPGLLTTKLREEADELSAAGSRADVVHEAADLLYFTLVTLVSSGVSLAEVAEELDRRALRVSRA